MSAISINDGPVLWPLQVYRGDTFTKAITLREDGVAIDLDGDTFKLRVRNAVTKTEVFTLELGSGITVPTTGRVQFTFSTTQTTSLDNREKYEYDLQWTRTGSGSGEVKTITKGPVHTSGDVTP